MNNPLIYIILPVYNGGEFFFQQLYTIKSQTYDNRHLIIINDGSTDNTESKLQEFIIRYGLTKKVTLILQKNTGQYSACGVGLEKVKEFCEGNYEGKYIAYCDADDLWTDNKLQEQIDFMQNNPNCDLSYHDCWLISGNNEIIGFSSLNYFLNFGKKIDAKNFFEICMGPCVISTTMMFKANRIDKILPVHPKFSQDWRVMLILSGYNAKIFKINKKYGYYRKSGNSSLANKKKTQTLMDRWNNYLSVLKFLIGRIDRSNNLKLNYMIRYYTQRVEFIKSNRTVFIKILIVLFKYPKVILYLINSSIYNIKQHIQYLNELRGLLHIKN